MTLLLLALACAKPDPQVDSAGEVVPVSLVSAGAVRTLMVSDRLLADLAWHPDGYLLVSDYQGEGSVEEPAGTDLLRVDLDGAVHTWATGFEVPTWIHASAEGDVYVRGQLAGGAPYSRITRISASGDREAYVLQRESLADMLTDADGGLLVASNEEREAAVYAFDERGEVVDRFVELARPAYLSPDPGGDGLWVSSGQPPRLYHLHVDRQASLVMEDTEDPRGSLGAIAATPYGVFVTDYAENRVLRVDADGRVWPFAGDGADESVDGEGVQASIDGPLRVTASPDGRTLYVLEARGAIREIEVLGDP